MTDRAPKLPDMKHVPWSEEDARANKCLTEDGFAETRLQYDFDFELVVTEKMDGAQVAMTTDNIWGRGRGGEPDHESYDLLKKRWNEEYRWEIRPELVIFGEWMYAVHSIEYTDLPDYLLGFAVLNRSGKYHEHGHFMGWKGTKVVLDNLGIEHVPELDIDVTERQSPEGESAYGPVREGYVIRSPWPFRYDEFEDCVAKCVRNDHVSTGKHWRHGPIETNGLVGD